MTSINVDFGRCESNGVCVTLAPDFFDLDGDDYLLVLRHEVTPDEESQVREAVRQCPRRAISIANDGSAQSADGSNETRTG
jgi:ferredoxin